MSYFYKNIVDIKQEYLTCLISILSPLIYDGIKKIYEKSQEQEKTFIENMKSNTSLQNPGVIKIFQTLLRGIKNINNNNIEQETIRIKENSKCGDWFDDLVKSVFKSHIILLTYSEDEKTCKLIEDKAYDKIDVNLFIHKCYIECAKIFHNYPELFWHGFSQVEQKNNQQQALVYIEKGIKSAIHKMLPMKNILQEYLENDYVKKTPSYSEIKEKLKQQNSGIYGSNQVNRIIESEDNIEISNKIKELSNNIDKIVVGDGVGTVGGNTGNNTGNDNNNIQSNTKQLNLLNEQLKNLDNPNKANGSLQEQNQNPNQTQNPNSKPEANNTSVFGKNPKTEPKPTTGMASPKLNVITSPKAIRGGNKYLLKDAIKTYNKGINLE